MILTQNVRSRASIALSVLLAILCGWLDTRASEVVVPVVAIALSTCGLTFLAPARWWVWSILIGISVPIAHVIVRWTGMPLPYPPPGIFEPFLALIPAVLGAVFARTFTPRHSA